MQTVRHEVRACREDNEYDNSRCKLEAPTLLNGVYYSSDESFVRPLIQARLHIDLPEKARFLAASHTGEEWAMFCIANYVGYDCEVFFATTGGKTPIRALTRKVADYVFNVCECRRVTSRVDVTNKLAIRHNKLFGFVLEGRLRQASPESNDILVFGMLREEYRYGKAKSQ